MGWVLVWTAASKKETDSSLQEKLKDSLKEVVMKKVFGTQVTLTEV